MGNFAPQARKEHAKAVILAEVKHRLHESLGEDNLVILDVRNIMASYVGFHDEIFDDFLNPDKPITPDMVNWLPTLLKWDLDPSLVGVSAAPGAVVFRDDINHPTAADVMAYRTISLDPYIRYFADNARRTFGSGDHVCQYFYAHIVHKAIQLASCYLVRAVFPRNATFQIDKENCPIHYKWSLPFESGKHWNWDQYCEIAPRLMTAWECALRLSSNDLKEVTAVGLTDYIRIAVGSFHAIPSKPWKRAFDIFAFLSFEQKRALHNKIDISRITSFPVGPEDEAGMRKRGSLDETDTQWIISKLECLERATKRVKRKREE
jgi:hypothetical protein